MKEPQDEGVATWLWHHGGKQALGLAATGVAVSAARYATGKATQAIDRKAAEMDAQTQAAKNNKTWSDYHKHVSSLSPEEQKKELERLSPDQRRYFDFMTQNDGDTGFDDKGHPRDRSGKFSKKTSTKEDLDGELCPSCGYLCEHVNGVHKCPECGVIKEAHVSFSDMVETTSNWSSSPFEVVAPDDVSPPVSCEFYDGEGFCKWTKLVCPQFESTFKQCPVRQEALSTPYRTQAKLR